jgi:hypothetical protein
MPETTFLPLLRRHFQINYLSALGSSLMWLCYLFADLKNAHLVPQSWIFLLATGCLTAICLGPGFTLVAGWYWREEILEHQSTDGYEVRVGDGEMISKIFPWPSLDGVYFGAGRGRFKVL